MDISYGSHKPTFIQKFKRVYSRLTPKGKLVFGVLTALLLYFILPFSIFSSSKNEAPSKGPASISNPGPYKAVPKDQFNTLSDLLTLSPKVSSVTLQYLSLPPYLGSDNQFPNYINGGNMLLSRNAEYVRLVKDSPKNHGFLFSKNPISQDDLSAIEIDIEFQISGEQEKTSLIGDGMAIWLTTEQLNQGEVFGMQGDFNGLGLFVDTYKNYNNKKNRHAYPYLSLQRNRYSANFYDKSTDGVNTEIGGCSVHKIYNNDEPTKMRIIYLREAKIFEIDMDDHGSGAWRTCYRREDVEIDQYIPTGRPVYLGVSAETGDLHHNVDIYSINVQTFRNTDSTTIKEIDSLGEGIKLIDSNNVNSNDYDSYGYDNNRRQKKQKRKTLSRLRRQERKLKQKDTEKYGSEHGFVGWFFGWVAAFLRGLFYLMFTVVVVYSGVVGYRVYKDMRRKKYTGGLL